MKDKRTLKPKQSKKEKQNELEKKRNDTRKRLIDRSDELLAQVNLLEQQFSIRPEIAVLYEEELAALKIKINDHATHLKGSNYKRKRSVRHEEAFEAHIESLKECLRKIDYIHYKKQNLQHLTTTVQKYLQVLTKLSQDATLFLMFLRETLKDQEIEAIKTLDTLHNTRQTDSQNALKASRALIEALFSLESLPDYFSKDSLAASLPDFRTF